MISKSSNYDNDPYDMFPSSSYTDASLDPQTVDQYVEFLKLGNHIKESLVRRTRYETSAFLLKCLRATINEQVKARLLSGSEGDYIYSSVEDFAVKKGYAAW